MKIAGHPIHPLIIHFPTTLLPMHYLLSLLYVCYNDLSFASAGFYCLVAGSTAGAVAMITGLIDALKIPKMNKAALGTAVYHGFLNGSIIALFIFITYKDWRSMPVYHMPGTGRIIFEAVLLLLLFIGNYLGGKLIYQHHIGIQIKKTKDGNPDS